MKLKVRKEEGVSFIEIWRKKILGRGSSLCKGPEAGKHPACSRKPPGGRGVSKGEAGDAVRGRGRTHRPSEEQNNDWLCRE